MRPRIPASALLVAVLPSIALSAVAAANSSWGSYARGLAAPGSEVAGGLGLDFRAPLVVPSLAAVLSLQPGLSPEIFAGQSPAAQIAAIRDAVRAAAAPLLQPAPPGVHPAASLESEALVRLGALAAALPPDEGETVAAGVKAEFERRGESLLEASRRESESFEERRIGGFPAAVSAGEPGGPRPSGLKPFDPSSRGRPKIPPGLERIYQELPGGAIRRTADDPAAAALRAADVELWTVRHGQAEGNRADVMAGGGTDSPLTSRPDAAGQSGELQAVAAAKKLYENLGGDRWTQGVLSGERKPLVILFSPLLRARQTANALTALLDEKGKELGSGGRSLYEAQEVADLREMDFGDLEGASIADAKKLPWWQNWAAGGAGRDFLRRLPNGESRFDVLVRQRKVFLWIAKRYRGRTVVTFAHFQTVTAQKAIMGLLPVADDQALRVGAVENAQPISLVSRR